MAQASSFSNDTPGRADYLDASRGLFVAWMLIAHSLTLAGIPANHWMQHLRPAGWASVCFVMLSGFGLAAVNLGRPTERDGFARRKYRRAFQLVVIAYLSNLASGFIVSAINGTLSAAYLLDVATFRVPWTISGSLIPVAAIVALSPALVAVARRVRPLWSLSAALALGVLAGAGIPVVGPAGGPVPLSAMTHWTGPLGVPLVYMLVIAVCAFCLGGVSARLRKSAQARLLPMVAAGALLSLGLVPQSGSPMEMAHDLGIFVVSIGVVSIFCIVPSLQRVSRALSGFGQSALLIFIAHRVLLCVAAALLRPALHREALAWSLMAVVFGTCGCAAWARQRFTGFRAALSHVGM
jgi:hypothetical protein